MSSGDHLHDPSNEVIQRTRAVRSSRATSFFMRLLLLALCSAYIQGGLTKVFDFEHVVGEFDRLGLRPAAPLLVATIALELVASMFIVVGYWRRPAALALALFTLAATLIVNRYWDVPAPMRVPVMNAFFEHMGLIAGFLLVAAGEVKAGIGWNGQER
jgi:uncharacterized membrane protein YphA (DoxX/SURF4 family)